VADLEELARVPGGRNVAANQVLYNLSRRGIEFDLLPWCAERALAVMAYSPLDEGRLVRDRRLAAVASRVGCDAAQLALAWALRDPRVCAIPKAASEAHVRGNRAALDVVLDASVLAALDEAFPPPRRKTPLGMI
jgi:diketogulonate reductase-like aldo/keto reductase